MAKSKQVLHFARYATAALFVVSGSLAQAALTTFPQSALVPTTQLYTDVIGGGIGNILVMTGGGNAPGIGDSTGRNDDGFSGPIDFGYTFSFFENDYTSFYANNNGNISFGGGNEAYIPEGPIGATIPTISIWFGDVDTRNSNSGVLYLRQDGNNQTILTWNNVGYYNSQASLLNTFQMVIRGSGYDVPEGEGSIGFFWLNMDWEATQTSTTAAVGFGDGEGNGVVLEGSNTPGLNPVVAYNQTWFTTDLRPVCGVPGTPDCESDPGNDVPEPATLALLGIGLMGIFARRRRPV